jgi:tripartite-type tricarboxylate transporter receptor subunit TctC
VIHRVLKRADVQQRFAEIGSSVALTPATEAQRFLASEVAAWTKVIRDAGIATQDF